MDFVRQNPILDKAMMSDNWKEEIKDIVEEKIHESEENNTEE